MHNKLVEIVEKKKQDLIEQKKKVPLPSLRALAKQSRGNQRQLSSTGLLAQLRGGRNDISILAEIKLASPTVVSLGSHDEIIERAIAYEKAGADAISFITEKHYFKGEVSFIPKLKQHVSLPILQKDFVIDEYQIYEAKLAGSDALLLIVKYLEKEKLKQFVSLCQKLGIEPVVEINDEEDLVKAVTTTTNSIAVNARDLATFEVNVDKACELLKKVPDKYITLGFSGVHSHIEVQQYKNAGVKGILVGTELMKAKSIEDFFLSLREIPRLSSGQVA